MGHGRARIHRFWIPSAVARTSRGCGCAVCEPVRSVTPPDARTSAMLVAPPRQDESDHAHLMTHDTSHMSGLQDEEEDRGFMILSVWTSSEIVIIRSATDTFSTHNAQLHTRSAAPLPSPPVHSFAQLLTCSLFCRARTRGNDCTRTPAHANCCETEPPRSSRQRLGR